MSFWFLPFIEFYYIWQRSVSTDNVASDTIWCVSNETWESTFQSNFCNELYIQIALHFCQYNLDLERLAIIINSCNLNNFHIFLFFISHFIRRRSELIIKSAVRNDTGRYECRAKNKLAPKPVLNFTRIEVLPKDYTPTSEY